MKKHNVHTICFVALILGWSCKEVYYPGDLESTGSIPVIQGMIQEGAVPSVNLSWALRYSSKLQEYINGAEVDVTDDLGNITYLVETGNGNYSAVSDEFKGMTGRTYTLHVRLPDGNEYASSPALLQGHPVIDSLYADPGIRETYTYNENNEPISEYQKGLFILADLSGDADSALYYRFNTKALKEITYTKDPNSLGATTVYIWETTTLDNLYSVNHSFENGNRQVLREHPVGFLHFDYNPYLETDEATAPYPVGWVLTFKVYALSAEVYEYYNSIAEQLNSNDQMFAPIPSQVKSTIRCLTDPEKAVIGVFEASSVTTVYKAFAWKDAEVYQSKVLQSFPGDIQDGMMMTFPPEFWVPFY
jgi:hypothetical protein